MTPMSEATKLESADGFVEYVGSGKLKDSKVLITGGEYVQGVRSSCLPLYFFAYTKRFLVLELVDLWRF